MEDLRRCFAIEAMGWNLSADVRRVENALGLWG